MRDEAFQIESGQAKRVIQRGLTKVLSTNLSSIYTRVLIVKYKDNKSRKEIINYCHIYGNKCQ